MFNKFVAVWNLVNQICALVFGAACLFLELNGTTPSTALLGMTAVFAFNVGLERIVTRIFLTIDEEEEISDDDDEDDDSGDECWSNQ